jgi:hypothetical protein
MKEQHYLVQLLGKQIWGDALMLVMTVVQSTVIHHSYRLVQTSIFPHHPPLP